MCLRRLFMISGPTKSKGENNIWCLWLEVNISCASSLPQSFCLYTPRPVCDADACLLSSSPHVSALWSGTNANSMSKINQCMLHLLKEVIGSDKVWTELRSADKFLDKVAYRDTRAACCKGHLPRPDVASGKIIRRDEGNGQIEVTT